MIAAREFAKTSLTHREAGVMELDVAAAGQASAGTSIARTATMAQGLDASAAHNTSAYLGSSVGRQPSSLVERQCGAGLVVDGLDVKRVAHRGLAPFEGR